VSGTFNAEYGNALSGIGEHRHRRGARRTAAAWSFNETLPAITRISHQHRPSQPFSHTVTEMTLHGPIPGDLFTFFLSGRMDRESGWLYGIREHNVTDYVYKSPMDPTDMTVISTGDNELVPMNPYREFSGTGKLSFEATTAMKLRYDALSNSSLRYSQLQIQPDARPIMKNDCELTRVTAFRR
jgi:hypothetical protein